MTRLIIAFSIKCPSEKIGPTGDNFDVYWYIDWFTKIEVQKGIGPTVMCIHCLFLSFILPSTMEILDKAFFVRITWPQGLELKIIKKPDSYLVRDRLR